jgi:uncharacterized protein YdhG (YjbR/CyaY superfamily)
LFPDSGGVVSALSNEFQRYEVAKGTIRFPIGRPLPTSLVKKLVKAKIAENEARRHR